MGTLVVRPILGVGCPPPPQTSPPFWGLPPPDPPVWGVPPSNLLRGRFVRKGVSPQVGANVFALTTSTMVPGRSGI